MIIIGEPDGWRIELLDGSLVEVWAHAYEETDGFHIFTVVAEIDVSRHEHFRIQAAFPLQAGRVIVEVARIASKSVASVRSF